MRLALVMAVLLLGCSAAHTVCPVPEACPACAASQPPPDAGVLPSDNMLGARWGELNATVATHVTLISPSLEPHMRLGGGFEFAKGIGREERVRLVASTSLTGGAWGDQQHGEVNVETGGGVRVSILGDLTLIDVYAQLTDDFIFGFGSLTPGRSYEPGNAGGVGIGLRLFRAFSVELTGRAIVAFDTRFTARDGTTARVLPELGLAFRFDTCSLMKCNYVPIQQRTEDVTCAIYSDAHRICGAAQSAGGSARADLCKNALKAMSLNDGDPLLARDAVGRFLQDLATNEAGTARAASEGDLVKTNGCLMDWRSCGRKQECLFSQQGQKPESRRMYSPYVLEVMAALGCTADGLPVQPATGKPPCDYTCEVPAVKPAACGAP